MNQISSTNNLGLRRSIMRRVWYAYGISVCMSRAALQGFLFGASMIAFWKLVSVTSIINNFLQVRMGDLPSYILQALSQAHVLALVAFGIMVFTLLSVGITLPRMVLQYRTQSA